MKEGKIYALSNQMDPLQCHICGKHLKSDSRMGKASWNICDHCYRNKHTISCLYYQYMRGEIPLSDLEFHIKSKQ